MADDTRLAEACLLLNYSEQSYKEQLSTSKQCLIEASNNHQKSDEQQLVAQTSSNCPSLVPIKQEQIVEYETLEAVNRYPDQLIDYETSSRSDNEYLKEASPHLAQRESCYNVYDTDTTQPMNSLLAAVNCALPSLKIRPTILQRSSSLSTPTKSFTNHSNLSDHDYCQSEYGLSTIDFLETTKQSGSGVESHHELVTNVDAKRQGEIRTKNRRKQRQLERLSPSDTLKKPLRFIAIHLGAGNAQNETESIAIAKSICEDIMLRKTASEYSSSRKKKKNCCLSSNGVSTPSKECRGFYLNEDKINAESAVVQLVKLMEDNQALNCGYGSNLNIRGQVECDASLMSDRTQLWTGVGAVSGCKNPILLAKSLFDHQTIPRHLGLIQPNILVGSGAKQWMQQHCPYLCIVDSKLVSSKSFETYQKLKSRFDAAVKFYSETSCEERHIDTHSRTNPSSNHPELNLCSTTLDHGFYCSSTRDNLRKVPTFARAIERINGSDNGNLSEDYGFCESGRTVIVESDIGLQPTAQDHRLDTVGAIAVDSDNCFASAISSGGLLLKCKGRLGQAAIPGAGCWSEDSVAVTTTGVGEYLTLNMFAKRFYDKMNTMRLLFDLGHIEKKSDLSNVFDSAMKECFDDLMKSPALNHVAPQDRLAGMLTVCTLNSKESPKRIDDKDLYLTYAHNTNSMCVAYMTCEDTTSNVFMSRKLQDGQNYKTVIKTIKLSPNHHDHVDNFVVHDSLNSTSTSS